MITRDLVNAGVAQLVEQLICNQPVASSSLVTSFSRRPPKINYFGGLDFSLSFYKIYNCSKKWLKIGDFQITLGIVWVSFGYQFKDTKAIMHTDGKILVGKRSKGTVAVESFRGRLRLRFRFNGQRYSMALGIPDTQINRRVAEARARQIKDDMRLQLAHGGNYFDPTLEKYKPESVLSVTEPDIQPETMPSLPELWQRYIEARQSGKSPATIRMYGWVANHLERCPHKLPTEAQSIFDWLNANVSANSTKRVLMHLSACCKWAKKSDLLSVANPFEDMAAEVKVKKSGTEEDEVNPFTREERDRIIAAFKTNR